MAKFLFVKISLVQAFCTRCSLFNKQSGRQVALGTHELIGWILQKN